MKHWPIKTLEEVCAINPKLGVLEAPKANDEVTFVPMAAIDEISGKIARPELRLYSQVAKGYTSFRENDILFAKITPCMQNGKAAIARGLCGGFGFGSTEFHILRPTASVLPEWVFAFIRQPSFRSAAEANFTGSAGQQRVPADFLRKFTIPIPPLTEQERIVKILDEADELRKLRAQADRRTADLIPALFHEMFGDPIENQKGWSTKKLPDICEGKEGIKAGPFGSSLKKDCYTSEGPRIYGQEQVIASDFSVGDYHISGEKLIEMAAYVVTPGDLLISLVGTIGKVAVVPDGIERGIINPRLLRVRPRREIAHPCYLENILSSSSTAKFFSSVATGITMGVLNAGLLKQLIVPVPPLPLQQEFAQRVAEIREMEADQAKSKSRLDALFHSLLHRAFEGEL